MQEQQWYSVRSVFRSDRVADGKPERIFEERVVVFRASSTEEALSKGRVEAQRYAAGETHPTMLDHIVAFALWEEELCEGEEVWSCLRQSCDSDEQYLDRVYAGEMLGSRHAESGD
jgi:hypothetical protein